MATVPRGPILRLQLVTVHLRHAIKRSQQIPGIVLGFDFRGHLKTFLWASQFTISRPRFRFKLAGWSFFQTSTSFARSIPSIRRSPTKQSHENLNQTFYPDIKFEAFSEGFLHGRAIRSTVIPALSLALGRSRYGSCRHPRNNES